jgi:copper(I)-binding protein
VQEFMARPLFLAAVLCAAATAAGTLRLEHAWVRAMPPMQRMTAAYLTLTNSGTTAVRIIGAEAEGAGRAELHRTVTEDGRARMEAVEGVTVAAGESLVLEPGGLHLMLLGLEEAPAEGETRELCLLTADGERLCTAARVRRQSRFETHSH